MERAVGHALAAAPWESDQPNAHVRRAAGFFAWSQTEPGHGCPISRTYATVPALRPDEAVAKQWTPLLASTSYVPGLRHPAPHKGPLAGMGMTEEQGGSDVSATAPAARPPSPDAAHPWQGHK